MNIETQEKARYSCRSVYLTSEFRSCGSVKSWCLYSFTIRAYDSIVLAVCNYFPVSFIFVLIYITNSEPHPHSLLN